MNKIQYRSPKLPQGIFNKPGVKHAHIDGAYSPELVYRIVKAGNPGTLDYVVDSIAGPQRQKLPEVYQSHTPVLEGEEAFDFFSTTLVRGRSNAITVMNRISDMLIGIPGAVVELEQNEGWLDANGWKEIQPQQWVAPLSAGEVRLALAPTSDFEIHHNFEIPKRGLGLPISLQVLDDFCLENGMDFGGWFAFDDGQTWGYWSNAFLDTEAFHGLVEQEQSILNRFLSERFSGITAGTLVERVLGICNSKG